MNNKLLSKEEMFSFLKMNKEILNKEIYEYLEGIVNLEYSIVKDLITNEQREALVRMQLYRSSLIYNIRNRDKKYFDDIYYKEGILMFGTNIQRGNIPCITLYNWLLNTKNMSVSELKEKIELTKIYLEEIKKDYDLNDEDLYTENKIVKTIPGLIVRQNFNNYY